MNVARLLDEVKDHLNIRFDCDLAKQLGYTRQTIETLRSGRGKITPGIEIAILEATNWTLWEMRGKGRG